MKREIMNLIKSEKGELRLNELFYLRKYQLNPETDILGRRGKYLEVILESEYIAYSLSYKIDLEIVTSYQDIINLIAEHMESILRVYEHNLIATFKGGRLI